MSTKRLGEHRVSRRTLLKWAGASAVAATALSACAMPAASPGQTPAEGEPSAGLETTEITMWHGWTGADNTEMLTRMIEGYNESNTDGVVVTPTAYGWDELFAKWVLASASGNPADVVLYHPTETPEFVERGTVMPLDELAEMVGWNWEGIAEPIKEQCYYNGTLYGIIEDIHPMGMYYNVDLAEQAGLDPDAPPATREEYLAWAEAMNVKDDSGNFTQSGISMPTSGALPRWTWHSYLYQNRGKFLNEDGSVAFNSDEGREALQFMHDLVYADGLAPISSSPEEDFRSNVLGILFTGPWNVNSIIAAGVNFATAPLPVNFDEPAAWCNSHVLSLSKTDSPDRQLAGMKFTQWFAQNNLEAAVNVGIVPVTPQVMAQLQEHERWEYYEAFADEAPYVAYEPMVPQYSQIFSFGKPTPLSVNIEAVLTNEKTVEQALDDMEAGIAEILATPIA